MDDKLRRGRPRFPSMVRFGLRNTLTRHVYSNHKIGAGRQESMLNTDSRSPHERGERPLLSDVMLKRLTILAELYIPLGRFISSSFYA
jgi:hypothetical protein